MPSSCYAARVVPGAPARKPAITIVGPGNLGSALALALRAAGYPIAAIVSRDIPAARRRARVLARQVGARATTLAAASLPGDVVWICLPDDALAACARALAAKSGWRGRIVLHPSGALSSDVLAPLRRRGAAVASLHPMMSFVRGIVPALAGVTFALEGDARALRVARRIASDLGGHVFAIRKSRKPLYHALGAFSSPLIVASLAVAGRVARAAGVPAASVPATIGPILQATLRNYLAQGPAAAFSGPLKRGDVATVRKHLRVLRQVPDAREVYLALARSALRNLPVKKRKELQKLLHQA
jgi:predicted short-subunit dehydrogenase-like oxidoreductase (DUF2520 family)